tara:strand:- start:944 stop:1108 length:165 start_codon:yes stop_codon:yes gene_type:complete
VISKSIRKPKRLRPSKDQRVRRPQVSIPSARKERQKYTSDQYREKFDTIKWSKR